jgi:hypothetical protein
MTAWKSNGLWVSVFVVLWSQTGWTHTTCKREVVRVKVNAFATQALVAPRETLEHLDVLEELDRGLPYRTAEQVALIEAKVAQSDNSSAKAGLARLKAALNQRHREITSAFLEKYSRGYRSLIPPVFYRNRIRNVMVRRLNQELIEPFERNLVSLLRPVSNDLIPVSTRLAEFAKNTKSFESIRDQSELLKILSDAVPDRVIVLESALKSAKGYRMDGRRLRSMLEILVHEVCDAGREGLYGRELELRIEQAAHQRGGIRYAHQDTGATRAKYGHLRHFTFRGESYDATPHLKYNGEPMIRIYFTYSRSEKKVLIYHIGPHLPSVSGD